MATNDGYESVGQGYSNEMKEYPPQEVGAVRRHHVFRFWPWEIMSLITAIGLIAATYSILSHFNGQKLPEWPFSINLNTLVALLSTFMRAAMLVCVAEIISQTKWSWFSRPRPLSHLQYFDDASRSFAGSLSLLFVAPGSLFGVLGALLTILSLSIGPFAQQAIRTVPCLQTRNELKASLPFSHYMPAANTYYEAVDGVLEAQVDMKGAMINGITNPTGNDSAIVPSCATGNCTFVHHDGIALSSMGMCSSCINTTSFIERNNTSNFTLPNKLWVSISSPGVYLTVGQGTLNWASSAFTPEFSSSIDATIINVTVLAYTTGWPIVLATSCSLYPCLKNYNATIERGVLKENVVSTQPAPINWIEGKSNIARMNYTALKSPCFVDDGWYDLSNMSTAPKTGGRVFTGISIDGKNYTAPDECLYKMWYLYAGGLSKFIGQNLFTGKCAYNPQQGKDIACGSSWWLASLYNNKQASFDTLQTAFDQFTTAITNKIRMTGSSNYDQYAHEMVDGVVNETTICTQFDWRWLLMPTILVAATGAVLIAIIVQNLLNKKQPVWKSSLLPLLYYGFDQRALNEDPNKPIMDLNELNQAAADTNVKLRNGAEAGFVDVTPSISEVIRSRGRDVDVDSLLEGR
ncbi:uncharacterized protein GGS22DRAFT_176841 [Annulohypoxylon maeteangense]|uniref:uncharacterized protein n=1 Tax=Annulohypoxylon maeteangense TaxID=1927788 RepID=UPI002007265C|nr:uncharacterized protein GGS22DRAFT_176841 [Annulohypoxylon maeteangense]KAI0889538.1 hypothetical protein GGS22DRAFT_176841 [Annulohypoxylon maeteangense]